MALQIGTNAIAILAEATYPNINMKKSTSRKIGFAPQQEAIVENTKSDIPASIGEQIRQLRKAKGLTISDLASRIEKSNGYISQIERSLSGVSISSLQKIAGALDVQISWFFQGQGIAPAEERDLIVRVHNRRVLEFNPRGITEELLSPTLTGQFEIIRTIFSPGASSGEDARTRADEEAGVLISGSLDIWIGDKQFHLNTGDSFSLPAGGHHRCENNGDVDAEVIWIISPPTY
ncbi:helix-turn-helix domain-containing protein [Sneathiella marina]|uniref:Helix-turn-helix domain-containing protein n=1 Tax=Sneathiella marina TaxID=2950108 RepID=A0ABY4W5X8_9PROT|nr:cupin domain-containing protein [Sneathiella marina]USG62600.1 helix-turn-helix domain-containing protein [Sneathiella marina]